MLYCEKCKVLSDEQCCGTCGNENLRNAKNEDFCFLVACEEFFGEMFVDALKNEGINCAAVPFGNGVRSQLGLTLGNYQLFVPYAHYEKAQDILDSLSVMPSCDNLKNQILENMDKWHIERASTEKKIRKKFKFEKNVDLFQAIKERVQLANSIEDVGLMFDGEHGLLVKYEGVALWFSATTYKISI